MFKFTHLSSDYKVYTIKRIKVKSMIRAAQAKYDQKLIDQFHDNPSKGSFMLIWGINVAKNWSSC